MLGFSKGNKRRNYSGATKGIVHQPELKDIMCYEYGKLSERLNKNMLWDKLIKKEVFIKALIFIGEKNLKERFSFGDDVLLAYAITNVAQSYTYLFEPGYYHYVSRSRSISSQKNSDDKSNQVAKYTFKIIEIVYDRAEDNNKSKRKALCFFRTFYHFFWSKLPKFYLDSETYDTINSVVDTFSDSAYIDEGNKNYTKEIRKEIFSKIGKIIEVENVDKNPNILE